MEYFIADVENSRPELAALYLGRDRCGAWDAAVAYEWLVTNGVGGFACGTVAQANTRRYHGLLMASLSPPVARTLLVAKVDLVVDYLGESYPLTSNEFTGGAVTPQGFVHLESFEIRDGLPVWRYALADAVIEQRIFMARGANTSYLQLNALRASAPMRVTLKPFLTYRDYHAQNIGSKPFELNATREGCLIQAHEGATPYRVMVTAGRFSAAPEWYWHFWHRAEAERGLDAQEDLLLPGIFTVDLEPRATACLIATAEPLPPATADDVLAALQVESRRIASALPKSAPPWIHTLAQASEQFIVRRKETLPGGATRSGASIIAGYPWFSDWGRDAMISLPGLTVLLGRYAEAADILKTYVSYVDRGMLPNRFPDGGEAPEYNTADATLWLFHALNDYFLVKRDTELLRELFPSLAAIIHAHADGTRFGIHVDGTDGLLCAGTTGTQLTWMDARQGDHAFTPRCGKPVEINALWLNALNIMVRLASRLREVGEKQYCQALLTRGNGGFARFWNSERGCLFDVIDVDGGGTVDDRIRPNQVFAVSLPYSALPTQQMRAVVDTCARELVTSVGLRSLSPKEPGYQSRYTGNPWQRDSAYHMGTAWGWLLGPFARAHYRVYGDARLAQSFLTPCARQVDSGCLGTLGEIFDGDAPHNARGCFAQAWSVAEILRSWVHLERRISAS